MSARLVASWNGTAITFSGDLAKRFGLLNTRLSVNVSTATINDWTWTFERGVMGGCTLIRTHPEKDSTTYNIPGTGKYKLFPSGDVQPVGVGSWQASKEPIISVSSDLVKLVMAGYSGKIEVMEPGDVYRGMLYSPSPLVRIRTDGKVRLRKAGSSKGRYGEVTDFSVVIIEQCGTVVGVVVLKSMTEEQLRAVMAQDYYSPEASTK